MDGIIPINNSWLVRIVNFEITLLSLFPTYMPSRLPFQFNFFCSKNVILRRRPHQICTLQDKIWSGRGRKVLNGKVKHKSSFRHSNKCCRAVVKGIRVSGCSAGGGLSMGLRLLHNKQHVSSQSLQLYKTTSSKLISERREVMVSWDCFAQFGQSSQ